MVLKRMFILSGTALGASLLLCSCASDVPVPEDAKAQEWAPHIKAGHSSWQPTHNMPAGNAEYDAVFAKMDAVKNMPVPPPEAPRPRESVRDEVVIEITSAADTSLLNGDVLPDKDIQNYLRDFAAASKNTKATVVWKDPAGAEQAGDYAKFCKELGIRYVETAPAPEALVKAPAKKTAPVKKAVKKAKPVKYVVDRDTAATEYQVKKGDTLSKIALKHYKNGNLWYLIFSENKTVLNDNANKLRPGMKLSLPALKKAETPAEAK